MFIEFENVVKCEKGVRCPSLKNLMAFTFQISRIYLRQSNVGKNNFVYKNIKQTKKNP